MIRLFFKISAIYYIVKFVLNSGQIIVKATKVYNKVYPAKPDPRTRKILFEEKRS
jgi:hypothetical protein